MGKIALLVVIVFLVALGYFAVLNKDQVTITVSPGTAYELPKIALILLCTASGAAGMLLIFFVRDTHRFILNRQYQRRQKKDLRVQELYSKALNAILADNEEEAKTALEEILREEPGHLDALLRLGDIAAQNEEYAKAAGYYRKAKDIRPENLEVLFSLVRVLERTDKISDALVYLDEILESDPDNLTALYLKRSFLEKRDEWDELIHLQRTIVKSEHNEKDRQREQENLLGYKYEQGRYGLENGHYEKAKKAFRTVLRLDKDFVPAYLGLAEGMLREGETEEAVSFLERGFEQTSSVIVLARLEDLLITIGEPARLIRLYKNALSRMPQNQQLRFFLGKLYYRLEMLDDAFDALSTVDSSGASYPEVHQLLGDIYFRHRQWDKAVDEYKKAVEKKKTLRLPYCCSICGATSPEWSGRCPTCRSWNSYQFNLQGACKA